MATDQGSDAAEFKGNDLFGSKEERREGVPRFPLRPLEPDCYFYRKTGYCRYGQLCMFNHPPPPKRFVQAKMRNNPSRSDQAAEEASNRVRKMECRGEEECLQYMRNGRCRFAPNCKYRHHPLRTSIASDATLSEYSPRGDALSGYENGGSGNTATRALLLADMVGQLQVSKEPESFLDASSSRAPLVFPHQVRYSNGYQDPAARTLSASKQNVRHTSVISGAKADHGINLRAKAEEHPEGRIQSTHSNIPPTGPTTVTVSPTGLPLRPGQPVCMYYSRYGLCKYGIGCGYDHPVGCGATSMLSSDQFPILNSRRKIV